MLIQRRKVPAPCPWICELTNDAGYVVYSALGSFYLPMLVMLFFYWRIYRAAVQTTRAINQGFRTTKGSRTIGNRFDEQRLTLRIHSVFPDYQERIIIDPTIRIETGSSQPEDVNKEKINIYLPTVDYFKAKYQLEDIEGAGLLGDAARADAAAVVLAARQQCHRDEPGQQCVRVAEQRRDVLERRQVARVPAPHALLHQTQQQTHQDQRKLPQQRRHLHGRQQQRWGLYSVHYSNGGREATSSVYRSRDPNCHLRVTGSRLASHNRRGSSVRRRSSTDSTLTPGAAQQLLEDKDLSPSPTFDDSGSAKPKLISRMGKRNIKAQVKRFRMETKAAKTLGIIVGGFIVCWLPFFTMYLVRAFCEDCIHHLLFSVLFWLGYCNSAINPCIYALFSKDFRFAFKRIICRCFCARKIKKETRDWARRRGSDGSQLGARGPEPGSERGRSPSNNNTQQYPHNSVGEDSDQGNDGSDSR
ncbi:hypothetical protein ANN_20768 [Periplaneta americana]|uniref:G-protein coupled receptors family 1 profile domain-containing protein n=1 Tax=Periplaneta americana TaxID=6978 RepID=A0ABQ8SDW1_PERAM|nr:hypothetical protein ANN_20768 [Periplaneta americana]